VQVDPVKSVLNAPGIKRSKLNFVRLVSNVAFKIKLRRYTPGRLREAEIVYDGARFVYYDDNILAAAAPAAAPPGEWHYVAVSVAADGEGILVVDGAPAVDFSTRSRPSGGSLTLCARLTAAAAGAAAGLSDATSHFAGEIDEVRVFAKPMTQEMIAAGAFSPDVAGEAGLVSLLNFTYGYDAYPALGLVVAGAPARVASTGQGLTLVHFSAQPEPFLTQTTPSTPLDTP
jgi:hypothetical protein